MNSNSDWLSQFMQDVEASSDRLNQVRDLWEQTITGHASVIGSISQSISGVGLSSLETEVGKGIWYREVLTTLLAALESDSYLTPAQFAKHWDIPLAEVNRSVNKIWQELEELGSLRVEATGSKALIFLSPAAQDDLRIFIPSCRHRRQNLANL
jgi:hypothetical protein